MPPLATAIIAITTFSALIFSASQGIKSKERAECDEWRKELIANQAQRHRQPAKWQIEQCKNYPPRS